MIFDQTIYSSHWAPSLPITPVYSENGNGNPMRTLTHTILGGLKAETDHWRFEPGLGVDFELHHALLLHTGFKLIFENDQVFELLQIEPGLFLGRIPVRATPELFATNQATDTEEGFSFLTDGELQIGLYLHSTDFYTQLVLCLHKGSRDSCKEELLTQSKSMESRLESAWESETNKRADICSRLPETLTTENPGLAIERVLGLIEPGEGIFSSSWIRKTSADSSTLSFRLTCDLLPAIALVAPSHIPELLNTLLELPPLENGAWAEQYSTQGIGKPHPALPLLGSRLSELPGTVLELLDLRAVTARCTEHIKAFLSVEPASGLPQWPIAETAFIPEVTDPDSLIQFDLAAFLVIEIEALRKLSQNETLLENERNHLVKTITAEFWDEKCKRFLDRTPEGEFASRVTAGTLLPLLWDRLDKQENSAIRQSLQKHEELRSPEGIRQWQPKKDDPIQPPVEPSTQHLFIPLLRKLSGEAAALLSADWHRSLKNDPECKSPETAALQIRLAPFSQHINPHLERYPAWVRSMEKHRQLIVTIAAAVIISVPAAFGVYFTFRSEYNRSDELLQFGQAETLQTMGNLEEAELLFTDLLANSRSDTRKDQYYLKRAGLRFRQEKFQEAMEDYLMAIELDPIGNLYQARWNLGQTYARLNRKPEAIEMLNAFIDEYGEELPEYKQRAEHAIRLWQR